MPPPVDIVETNRPPGWICLVVRSSPALFGVKSNATALSSGNSFRRFWFLMTSSLAQVASVLRVMGLSHDGHFQNYHRVLNRDQWASRALSLILLRLLLDAFVPATAPVVVGLDEHIERRRGAKIAAKGIYRDPVRSSKAFFVKTSGLRWLSLQLLAPIPWAQRVWALPFLTVLAPSARYH